MSHKSPKIALLIEGLRGQALDAHYLGYFECFNRQLYFEAHEVLEELWLKDRAGPQGPFYKGLIQLAGAFVHLQKRRLQPAIALFRLARRNLESYPTPHEQLDIADLLKTIDSWLSRLDVPEVCPMPPEPSQFPRISLVVSTA
jgi:predicted metal-dependent hydrolase